VGWKPAWRVASVPVAIALAVATVGVIGTRVAIPLVRRDNPNVPVTAFAHVPPQLMGQHVLNEYAFGGYLIFKGVKVFVDGRADMYGDAWVQQYLAIVGGQQPDVDKAFKRWNITWAIVSPKDGIVRLLDERPGWRRLYSNPYAVLFARDDALGLPAPGGPATPGAKPGTNR
jgi:hypothetical protein